MNQSDIQAIRDRMVVAAKSQDIVYYGELMALGNLDHELDKDRAELGALMATLNDAELIVGNPPISSVAVGMSSGNPSQGFFDYVDENNLRHPGEGDVSVFVRLLNDCHNCTTW